MEVQFKVTMESPQHLRLAHGIKPVEWGRAPLPRKDESVSFPSRDSLTRWHVRSVDYVVFPSGLERVEIRLKGLRLDTVEKFSLAVEVLKEVGFTVTEKNMKEDL
jgi:hypothetical protein